MYGFNNYNRCDVIRVNGENGARAYQLAPNSSILLLDETAPIIWLAQTDGAGYKTLSAYDITPHKEPEPVDLKALSDRIARLESMFSSREPKNQNSQKPQKFQDRQEG